MGYAKVILSQMPEVLFLWFFAMYLVKLDLCNVFVADLPAMVTNQINSISSSVQCCVNGHRFGFWVIEIGLEILELKL